MPEPSEERKLRAPGDKRGNEEGGRHKTGAGKG